MEARVLIIAMVVFTCGHCGESVQKPKVEKHYLTKCRNRNPNLSCMDCFKDFLGHDYEAHIKCVTEEERYSGKGFVSKEKKGEKKQNAWVEMLQGVLEEQKTASKNVLRIIETISKHNNTPRKKPKFINFVKNVCGNKTNPKDIDQAWDLISVKLSALSNANNRNQNKPNDAPATDKSEENGGDDEQKSEKENGVPNNEEEQNGDDKQQNGVDDEQQNGDTEQVDKKKLTKKQRKEEKKHKKYEAELQSAGVPHSEDVEEEETENKKGKKKKTKSESANGDEDNQSDGKNKNKKRKRQDTVNSVNGQQEAADITDENNPIEPVAPATGKTQKKKIKMDEDEEADESICLHDQNVAKIGELAVTSDKFNWHAVIISLLEKKGELPFKRLQKKVLGEYSEATGRDVDDRIADKFIKKLKSAPNVRVDKNRVLLID